MRQGGWGRLEKVAFLGVRVFFMKNEQELMGSTVGSTEGASEGLDVTVAG